MLKPEVSIVYFFFGEDKSADCEAYHSIMAGIKRNWTRLMAIRTALKDIILPAVFAAGYLILSSLYRFIAPWTSYFLGNARLPGQF